jgi:hypothetical protein
MHRDVEQVERLAHGELDASREAELRDHLRGCAHCARRLDAAMREDAEIGALLRQLDHPAPIARADALIRRSRGERLGAARIAAGLAFALLTAGVLYAMPGSPLPRLLDRAPGPVSPAPPTVRVEERPPRPAPAGIAIPPGADLTVIFSAGLAGGTATVRLVDAPELSIRGAGDGVEFDLGVDRVTVAGTDAAGDYQVLVPRDAPSVRIRDGATVVWEKSGDRVASVVDPAADGAYVVPVGATR